MLPKRLRRKVTALGAVSVRLGDGGPTVDADALAVMANACRDAEALRFDYSSASGAASTRAVEPYRLVHTSRRWYLLAYDLDRGAWRTFRVDRIQGRPKTAGRFEAAPAARGGRGRLRVEVGLRGRLPDPRAVAVQRPRRPSPSGSRAWRGDGDLAPDRCVVHTGGGSLDALAFHLGFMGFEFEVHGPEGSSTSSAATPRPGRGARAGRREKARARGKQVATSGPVAELERIRVRGGLDFHFRAIDRLVGVEPLALRRRDALAAAEPGREALGPAESLAGDFVPDDDVSRARPEERCIEHIGVDLALGHLGARREEHDEAHADTVAVDRLRGGADPKPTVNVAPETVPSPKRKP